MLERYGLKDLPVYYTEWGANPQLGAVQSDLPYSAAWVVRGLFESLDNAEVISWWTGSDYFEERGPPEKFLHGGFGLLGLDGIRKPQCWAFHLLHQLGTRRVALEGEGDGFGGLVNGWATCREDGTVRILIWNVTYEQSNPHGNAILDRRVTLRISGLPADTSFHVEHFRVDNEHSNLHAAWVRMGKPDWPTATQLGELRRGDELQALGPGREMASGEDGAIAVEFDLPMPALVLGGGEVR